TKVNLLISGKLLLKGNTRVPPVIISSVEILSPIFNNIGKRHLSGKSSISGIESTFGPLFKLTCFASSYGKGSSNKLTSLAIFSGPLMIVSSLLCLLVSVISTVIAASAAFQDDYIITISLF